MSSDLTRELREQIDEMEIINTHEHLINREMLHGVGFDLFQAIELYYLKDDLVAVGMDENLITETMSEPDKLIDQLAPFLKQTRNTTYYQAFFRALRDLHGLDGNELDSDNLKAVSESIKQAYGREDWYEHVIRERCKIKCLLREMEYMPATDEFVKPVIRMDCHLIQRHKRLLKEWVDKDSILTFHVGDADYRDRVRTLDDQLALIEEDFQTAKNFGAVAIKIAMAYRRTLEFENVSVDDANRAFKLPDEKTSSRDIKVFQDYILFRLIEKAAEHGLPVQIHTGLLAGGKNYLGNTNPLLLTNLFLEFPNVKFDIFHGGFPFMGEIGSLALMFPNVYLDTCWLPLISYESFKKALSEWLCYVPAGKFLWGGDCAHVEGIYAATRVFRQGLSEVLAAKIEEGQLDKETAIHTAQGITHNNAAKLFGL